MRSSARRVPTSRSALLLVGFVLWGQLLTSHGQVLTTLEYRVAGASLRVSPSILSVPKNIAGSVLVELTGGSNSAPAGAFVEATLRGPSFPARVLIGPVNAPLLLPPLPLTGDYQLDAIRLVRQEGTNKIVLLEGLPSSVPVRVFDEVLVSRVTSRPLTLEEIRERGIVIDENNFRTVEFEVGFVLDGKIIPVKFPVVAPTFQQSTEIIPNAEIQAKLALAEELNRELAANFSLPPELETARVNIDVRPINFQVVDDNEQDLLLRIPPIPALMVVPGNIGFLNQFFSVQIFTENAAPHDSGLSVFDIKAELKLPPGPDQVISTNFSQPGDDPLRFARVGTDETIAPVQPVVGPGADGKVGTSDDLPRLFSGNVGQGEFLLEGLQEGLHVMNIDLTASLDGLAAGTVKIQGKAAGSVLVRNPRFSLAFSHPRTVRFGELYDAYVTVLNTGGNPANLVQVTLASASISGGNLESPETVILGTILPGQTGTAKFTIRALRTGAISFSNLTTSDDSVVGRFRLRMGVDERGVILSPDTLALPDFVTNLPPAVVNAAHRILGQALSIATAGQLPPGVKPLGKSIVTRRALELAEAGQRVQYADGLARVLPDLLLDWQGARVGNEAFDQIVFETNAGREWREVLALEMDRASGSNAVNRLVAVLPDVAGRSERWALFALDVESGTVRFGDGQTGAVPPLNTNKLAAGYNNTNASSGQWLVTRSQTNLLFEWNLAEAVSSAQLALAYVNNNGAAQLLRWTATDLAAGSCVRFSQADPASLLSVDNDCDGSFERTVSPVASSVGERPPEVLALLQEPGVLAGRPGRPCFPSVIAFPLNYGTVLAVLFSKPMTQERVNAPSAYVLDNGNVASSVQIQPGGRVALLNMRRPAGGLRSRSISVSSLTDLRGNPVTTNTLMLRSTLTEGVAVRGRVARADGSPAIGVPVTLTYYDRESSGFGECPLFTVRASQVFADDEGFFEFDLVLAGIPYSVSATDTTGLTPETIALILDSARGDSFARDKLLELANSVSVQNTLLAEFATGALPEAVAKAEGLDRALLRDFVPVDSPRVGTEVPVALRFRGRGAVSGQVVAADGITPVANVPINLFPDPDSRELGRGLFTDENGRFAFFGVPLGTFTLKADTGTGLNRTLAGVLLAPGQTTNVLVVLSSAEVVRTDLAGQVLEADQVTPHGGGSVFIGRFVDGVFRDVVAAVTADNTGYWRASGIPIGTYDVVALSFDGRRKGDRRDIAAPAGLSNFVTLALQGFGVVIGRVETARGEPVVNAIVGGGDTLVRTTNNGFFRLTGVPTGRRTINAGVERTLDPLAPKSTPASPFPRLGQSEVNVVPGAENFVLIRFAPRGSVVGRVFDETGTNAVTNINVALPEQNGFQWVPVDKDGKFVFEGLPLKKHTFSTPAPAVFDTDVSGALKTLSDSNADANEIQAAIGEAFAIFTGAADPLLNGEGDNFNPDRWGFTETTLSEDGEVKNITVQFLRAATIGGRVINSQGVPIGARVRLTGIGPAANGTPSTVIRGERNSDPALGTFLFDRQAFVGSYGLQAASPFFPVVLTTNGFTSEVDPFDTNVVLQFPSAREVNGRIAGFIFNPDGSPAAPGVKVRIRSFDLEIETRTNGFFDTQIALPTADYFVEAEDLVSGARAGATLRVLAGITNQLNLRLLGRGALLVTVLQNNGAPAAGAIVDFEQANFPRETGKSTANANGQAFIPNVFEGNYAVCAQFNSGNLVIGGRTAATVSLGATQSVVIRLGPTATIEGIFVRRDFVTPIGSAQIAVGNLGFATTASNGTFSVGGLPLGTYRLSSHDPVTGAGAVLTTTLTDAGQTNRVVLVEQSRGEIRGAVINSDGTNVAPGVNVTLRVFDGITPARVSSSGPDGRYSFPGVPAGRFELHAEHPVTGIQGVNSGTLPEGAEFIDINVALQPLAAWTIAVVRPDGVTPATNATVFLENNGIRAADTDSAGRVSFSGLPLLRYVVTATSRTIGETRSVARTNVTLSAPGQADALTLRLAGVGRVTGKVFLSDGLNPAVNASITLTHQGAVVRDVLSTATDSGGNFVLSNVAVGPYVVNAQSGVLGARTEGTIAADGEIDVLSLSVEASGTVRGRLVRTDGVTAVAGEDIVIMFPGRGIPGAIFRTGTNGTFQFEAVPLGTFQLKCVTLGFNGILLVTSSVTANGQIKDLGDLVLDEDDPRVVLVTPPDTAIGVPITSVVELVFNEALAADSVNATGVYLQGPSNTVLSTVQLLNDSNGVPRRVRVTPTTPLRSLTTYRVVVVDGERLNAFGAVIGSGPTDLVGRPLIAPFLSTFTTADNTPPQLVSIFPTNGQVQIDIRAVMRLSFNEPVRAFDFVATLSGPGGVVPGIGSVGLNGLVLTFAPLAALPPNGTFTLTVSNIFDLAGNRAVGEPFSVTFTTVDTLGPTIASLSIANGKSPVAGGTVPITATLAVDEPGVIVHYFKDGAAVATDLSPPYQANVTLPTNGTTTLSAFAVDRFGNHGSNATLVLTVVPNQPPTVSLTRVSPATGPVTNGQTLALEVMAADDLEVSTINVSTTGAFGFGTNLNGLVSQTLTLIVPDSAVAGALLQVRAQAVDQLGRTSAVSLVEFEIRDTAGPRLTILSPAADTLLNPPAPLELVLISSDNSTNHQIEVALSGGIIATQTVAVGVGPGIQVTNRFNFSLSGAPTNGATITATIRAHDASTNLGLVSRSFRLPDLQRPRLVSVNPTNGAARQSLWLNAVRYEFDEALNPLSITTNQVVVTNNAGVAAPFSIFLASDRRIDVSVARPLVPGTVYTNILRPNITDTSNNPWLGINGVSVPADGLPFVFTTAALLPSGPTNGTRVIAGQRIEIQANYEAGLGANFFRFQFEGNAPVQVSAGATSAVAMITVPTNAPVGTRLVNITASPVGSFVEPLALPPVQLQVFPLQGDVDADQIPNSYEIANDLDPFFNDAAQDPDGDGLTNLQEFEKGTRARLADTDGDGVNDGLDENPLDPGDGVVPVELTFDVTGVTTPQAVNQDYGDRVTAGIMGSFRYGGISPSAPNISLAYGTLDPVVWTTGYGSLTNVLIENADITGVLTVNLAADFGVNAVLHRFDLAAFTAVFASDPVVSAVEVLDANGQVLFQTNNATVSRTTFTRFQFAPPLSATRLTIRVDARNLGGLNDDIGIDNIRFSQSQTPLCLAAAPPVSLWRGDGNVLDSVTNNHGALFNGVGFSSGLVGSAFTFNGTNSFVSVADSPSLRPASVTLEGWFKFNSLSASPVMLVSKPVGSGVLNSYALFLNNGRLSGIVGSLNSSFTLSPLVTLAVGQWQHLAYTFDDTDNIVALYLDGVLVASQTVAGSIGYDNHPLLIGAESDNESKTHFLNGLADEVAVHGRALSADEVAALALAGGGKCAPGENPDTDSDGMPDGFEFAHHLDPRSDDSDLDPDNDGLANAEELLHETLPRVADTDADLLNDGAEVLLGCSNPLAADTDGDGLLDGVDPNPCVVVPGVTVSSPPQFGVKEGTVTNLTVRASAEQTSILLLDYSATNPPPAFVSIKSRSFSNTLTNGVATLELEFNPLHDAAGSHTLDLRAVAGDGTLVTFAIQINVTENAALLVTRWKEPVNGNWSDPARWSDGLPAAGRVAVIDAEGGYTVNLNTSVTAAGLVLDHSNAVMQVTANVALNAPFEVRHGQFNINNSRTFTMNRPLVNHAVMRWVSAFESVTVLGSGWVENHGLWEFFQDPDGLITSADSDILLPVHVPAGGTLLLSTNGLVNFGAASSLTVAGELELQSGSRLRLQNIDPAGDVTLLAGSAVNGTGTIQVDGGRRVATAGDFDSTVTVFLNHVSSQLIVPGTYTVRTSRSQIGTVLSQGVVVLNNAVLTVNNAAFTGAVTVEDGGLLRGTGSAISFGSHVLVRAGGRLDMEVGSPTVNLTGVLTNRGVMRWISAFNTFVLQGGGRVENEGLWEVFKDPAGFNANNDSDVRLPVHVPVGGKLLLSTSALLNFGASSSLTVAGAVEIQSGARLKLQNVAPAGDLTLVSGSSLTGIGTIQLDGSRRILTPGDFDSNVSVVLNGASTQLIVPGTYTVRSSRTQIGSVLSAAVVVSSNVVLTVNSAVFTGAVTVEEGGLLRGTGGAIGFGSNVLVRAGGRLDMEVGSPTITLSGVLTNRGVMRWISAFNTFSLQGSGRVENEGLCEVFKDPAGFNANSDSDVRLPVFVSVGGKLLLSTNALLNFGASSSLTVAGALEIQSGARLRLQNVAPAGDLTLLSGSTLSGTGTIQLDDSRRMIMPGDLDSTVTVQLNGSSTQLIVPGTYTVRSSRTQIGAVQSGAVVVLSNVVLTVNSAVFTGAVTVEEGGLLRGTGSTISFGSNVLVRTGGRLDMEVGSPTITLNGVLTNRGVMRWISAFNTFGLQGSGRVENEALWEVFKDPGGFNANSDSDVRLPVQVSVGGKLLLSTNALLNLRAGSSLAVEGELEIQTGALLRFENSSPARDLTVSSTASLTGAGTIRFEGSNRLVLLGNATIGVGLLELAASSSSILGTGTLTVAAGAKLHIGHSTSFGGAIVVSGTLTNVSGSTFTISGNVVLQPGGIIGNAGTIFCADFINNGGTVNGNVPQESGGGGAGLAAFRIENLTIKGDSIGGPGGGIGLASEGQGAAATVRWTGPPNSGFVVEGSVDLRQWQVVTAVIEEVSPGVYVGRLTLLGSHHFLRVRQTFSP